MKKIIIITIFLFYSSTLYSQMSKPELSYFGMYKDIAIENEIPVINIQDNLLHRQGNKKSVGLAVILSLLLPGMGELYAGDYRSGKYFTALEGTLWLTYASIDLYGIWTRDDARKYASKKGGIVLAGQGDKFFTDIGNYIDVNNYNDRKLQERQIDNLYDPNSIYFWKWTSDSDRSTYRNLRIKSDQAFNSLQFVLGAVLINHVVSAVNAARLTNKFNKEGIAHQDLNVVTQLTGTFDKPHFIFKITKTF